MIFYMIKFKTDIFCVQVFLKFIASTVMLLVDGFVR